MRVLAAYNIKGGVGKTATAVNLAYLSAAEGARTLVWDLDPQGAASFYFRVRSRLKGSAKKLIRGRRELDSEVRGTDFEMLDLLPADYSFRNLDLLLDRRKKPTRRLLRLLVPLMRSYDNLILDCAPNISLVSEAVFVAADALLVPTVPTTLCLSTLDQIKSHIAGMGRKRPKILPFFCMVDRRRNLHREICNQHGNGEGFLSTQIPYASAVEQMGVQRAPLASFAPKSAPARAYAKLWNEIKDVLGSRRNENRA